MGRIYTSGPRAGETYGSPIWGISRKEGQTLRRRAANAYRIGGRGQQQDLVWQLNYRSKDPERLAGDPLKRWAKEYYWASEPGTAPKAALRMGELYQALNTVKADRRKRARRSARMARGRQTGRTSSLAVNRPSRSHAPQSPGGGLEDEGGRKDHR